MKSLFQWILASLSAVLAIFATDQVDAQTFLGNGTAVWSDPTNWSGDVVPSGATALTFGGAPINTTSFNDYVGLTVLGINFTNGTPALWANPEPHSVHAERKQNSSRWQHHCFGCKP